MLTRAWASGISIPERRAVDAGMFANCLLDRLAGAFAKARWLVPRVYGGSGSHFEVLWSSSSVTAETSLSVLGIVSSDSPL